MYLLSMIIRSGFILSIRRDAKTRQRLPKEGQMDETNLVSLALPFEFGRPACLQES